MNFTTGFGQVKRQRFGFGTLLMMLLFGTIFTAVGLLAVNVGKIDPSWVRVSGEVVSSVTETGSHGITYAPVVRYSVNGQTYTVTSSVSNSFSPAIGSTEQVAYNPQDAASAKVVTSAALSALIWLFPGIGILILLGSPVLFFLSLKRSNTIKKLIQSGRKIPGILTDVKSTGSTNNRYTYKLIVSATNLSGVVQDYVSDSITGGGSLMLAQLQKSLIPLDVYVDPGNPQNYYVDISEVPNLTPEGITQLLQAATQQNIPLPPR